MPRGGYRPNAPQNNPMNINGRGGNGQSGRQAPRYMAGGKYGEGKRNIEMQQSAPMYAAPQPKITAPQQNGSSLPALAAITDPTQRPNEPLTHGMPFGPGGGPEVLGKMGGQQESLSQTLAKTLPYDTTGELNDLYNYLVSRGM